jgi:hypothetical protein
MMMTSTTDSRKSAQARIRSLILMVDGQPPSEEKARLIEECEALERAIAAFHMEAIRFRSYNVDRLLQLGGASVPSGATDVFAEMRKDLEAAGFHTRSH